MEKGVLLCVDDEIIVLTALKDQLRRAFGSDFLIDVAESAEEALELLEEVPNLDAVIAPLRTSRSGLLGTLRAA